MRSELVLNSFRVLIFSMGLLCTAPLLQGRGSAEETQMFTPSEYTVKAAFVLNFVKFVEWPLKAELSDRIRLCVLGNLPDAAAFTNLSGRPVRGKRMSVLALERPSEGLACEVLFVTGHQTGRLPEIIKSLDGRPVLTIGDTEGYAQRGIMINMLLENKHVRFEINEEKARAAGLRISVKLLKLASKVYASQ